MKVAEPKFIEVTGIKMGGDKKTAEVEFAYQMELTSDGKRLIDAKVPFIKPDLERQTAMATLELYDDGWRLKE